MDWFLPVLPISLSWMRVSYLISFSWFPLIFNPVIVDTGHGCHPAIAGS